MIYENLVYMDKDETQFTLNHKSLYDSIFKLSF